MSLATARAVGTVEFIHAELGAVSVSRHVREQIAQEAVYEPGRGRGALSLLGGHLCKSNLELVDAVVPRLVHTWRWLVGPTNMPENK